MKKPNVCLLSVVLALYACGGETSHHGKTPLVEVDGTFLYKEDVKAVMPVGIAPQDSARFTDNYIRNWVEDVLLYAKAKDNVVDNERVENLVQNYRKSLIMHEYQQSLIEQKLASELTDEEMRRFYDSNKSLFKADETLVKGLFIKVPLGAKGIGEVRKWYKQNTEAAVDKLEKYSLDGAADYLYFYDHWIPASMLLSKLPRTAGNADQLFRRNGGELRDTAFCYFLHTEQPIYRGEVKPFDAARTEIKQMMLKLKQARFMQQVRTDLYQDAMKKKDIKYYD